MMLQQAPLAAFAAFGRHMLDSWDIDPVYPVLRQLVADLEITQAQAEWLTVLYLAWYDLASATEAFLRYPDPEEDGILSDTATLKLPTGIERRGLRSAATMRDHLADWLARFDGRSFFRGASDAFGQDRLLNNDILSVYFAGVRYNGRWAAYKGCEVLHKVLDWRVAARDAGHMNSTGPREGLTLFFPRVVGQRPADIALLNYQTDVLMQASAAHGVELAVEEVETLLCDFKSLSRGRYYVGHDTDLMLEGVLALAPGLTRRLLISARRALPPHYRGEKHGWERRDREAMRAYVERGSVLYRSEAQGHFLDAAAVTA